jgi:hypothetical protein
VGKILVYKFSDDNKACDSEPVELKIVASNNTFLLVNLNELYADEPSPSGLAYNHRK